MAEEAALPTIEELVGLGEGELIAAAPEAAAVTAAAPVVAAAAPAATATTAEVAPAAGTLTADLGAGTGVSAGLPFATGGETVTAPVSQGAFDTQAFEGISPTSVESAGGLPPSAEEFGPPVAAPELTAEEASKKIAAEQAASQGYSANKALQYLGLTSPTGLGPNALPAAALGLSQYRANKMGQSIKDQLQAASAQTKGVATGLIDQYQTGQINPAQEKQISDLTNNTKARIKQRYAQMGRDPNTDSAAQSELAKADADAVAMRDAAQQGILTQGLKAAGLAQGPATSAVMAGYQSDLQQQQAMQNFMNTLAIMQSRQTA